MKTDIGIVGICACLAFSAGAATEGSLIGEVVNPDTADDSFAIGVWGALVDYDWVDLVK